MMRQDFAVHTKEVEKSYGKHLEQLEKQLGVEIKIVSVGPHRLESRLKNKY